MRRNRPPDDRVPEGGGALTRNRHRTRNDDPHFTGSVRVNGRIVKLEGWFTEPLSGESFIRLRAREQ